MSMKILWQTSLPSMDKTSADFGVDYSHIEDPSIKMLDTIKQVARPDTDVHWNWIKRSAYMLTEAYLEMLNNVAVLEEVIAAEEQGFDAVVLGCGNDPALKEARQAVDIPVLAPCESAMLLACTLGSKFGVVAAGDKQSAIIEENIHKYGLSDRAVPRVQRMHFDGDLNEALGKVLTHPELANPSFEEAALACIDQGADVVLAGCTGISVALSQIGYRQVADTGVPVLDINQAALKFAEMQVDLKRSIGLGKSQSGLYQSTPKEVRDQMRKLVSKA